MPQAHSHHHSHHSSTENIKVAFFLNLAFTLVEFVGGILTNSVAIMADSLHDLGDSLSLGFAWYFQKFSEKKRSKVFTYGYKRYSLLSALICGIVLVVGSIIIMTKAVGRLLNPAESNAAGMLFLALLGITVNGIAVLKLRKGNSLNEKVVSWHLLEDVLGWVAILIVSTINLFYSVPFLDPALAMVFALVVAYNGAKNLKKILIIFLQGAPSEINLDLLEKKLASLKGVVSVHDIHVWTLDGEYNLLTVHVVTKERKVSNIVNIKGRVRSMAKEMKIQHVTIEIELVDEHCLYFDC